MSEAEQIAASLTEDQQRMVMAGRVDTGGEGSERWESIFGLDSRIWQRTTIQPEPRLTKLGLKIYYAIASDRSKGDRND